MGYIYQARFGHLTPNERVDQLVNELFKVIEPVKIYHSRKSESVYLTYYKDDLDELFDKISWRLIKEYHCDIEDEDLSDLVQIRISSHENNEAFQAPIWLEI